MDFSKIKKIHFLGIKGVALSGLAVICKQLGFEVAGSDVPEVFITDKILKKNKIKVFKNFSPKNLDWQPDLVVVGASWSKDHPEILKARQKKIKIIFDSDLRGYLSRKKETIAVCGIHGKTTTTALLAYIFKVAELKPSYLVGTGLISDLGGNAEWNSGRHFIVEGDEYVKSQDKNSAKFLDLNPKISIITSLEWEHVDVYKNILELEEAFSKLINRTENLVVACSDWPSIKKIIAGKKKRIITYGFQPGTNWQIIEFKQRFDKSIFKVKNKNNNFFEFEIKLLGRHNALNALACAIIALELKIPLNIIKKALKNFEGLERRTEILENKGIVFVDDYGHHPTEIRTTLLAIRQKYPNKIIWCVFQPHMASRTKAFLTAFAKSFAPVNTVVLLDIFASAREKSMGITSKDLARETEKYHSKVIYGGSIKNTVKYLKDRIRKGEVVVTMGAGDVYKIKKFLISKL